MHINYSIIDYEACLNGMEIGKEKLGPYNCALTVNLTAESKFSDARKALNLSIEHTYGQDSPEAEAAEAELNRVGITGKVLKVLYRHARPKKQWGFQVDFHQFI